jgi:hypothetical protein
MLQRRTLSLSFQHQAAPIAPSPCHTQNRHQGLHRAHRFLCMHCLVDDHCRKGREMLLMLRQSVVDLLRISRCSLDALKIVL